MKKIATLLLILSLFLIPAIASANSSAPLGSQDADGGDSTDAFGWGYSDVLSSYPGTVYAWAGTETTYPVPRISAASDFDRIEYGTYQLVHIHYAGNVQYNSQFSYAQNPSTAFDPDWQYRVTGTHSFTDEFGYTAVTYTQDFYN